jgi:hypothetical protein
MGHTEMEFSTVFCWSNEEGKAEDTGKNGFLEVYGRQATVHKPSE